MRPNGFFRVKQVEQPPPPHDPAKLRLMLNSHTVCRGPDGRIKWEADTVPIELPIGTYEVCGEIPNFVVDTAQQIPALPEFQPQQMGD